VKRKVLFLCTGNSARSQMAEAIVNARLPALPRASGPGGDEWQASSAGTQPADAVHPAALRALAEIGIIHRGWPKPATEFRDALFDLAVTVCDDAAENCPVWLGKGRRVHLAFPDPAKATGTEDEILAVFRAVRDDIARQVPDLLRQWTIQNT
jgi:arsenate reductase